MAGTRSSTRQAAAASSSPTSSQGAPAANTGPAGRKRKGDSTAGPKSKRGKKGSDKAQATIEDTMPTEEKDDSKDDPKDVEMKDDEVRPDEATANAKKPVNDGGQNELNDREVAVKAREDAVKEREEALENGKAEGKDGTNGTEESETNKVDLDPKGDLAKLEETGDVEAKEEKNSGSKDGTTNAGDAVEESSKRGESTPSSILEKGIIYFFFRGRVGIDEPSDVNDVARSYIVLRPIPHGSKLGDGPIGDAGTNRLLALPKKVLPSSPKDRFMIFVEKAKASMEDIKSFFASSDYTTKTAGTRHTPSATPIGEGVYAITTTGRESHLAYILTIPSELSEVQKDVGLQERGSFVTSVKNPQYSGPANATLPEGPKYPQEILDEFRSLRWMPLQPKLLDYVNTQFLVIGHAGNDFEKATEQQPVDEKHDKDTPLEEMEKLEQEDELRVEHLKGDDSVFVDLGLSSKEYPKIQTTW
ncbi:hypothetical protein MMC07_001377 [Pseudocyphellaria aurata]|nr:hypothetical protein [Pseudocyphellaria aurata]